MRILRDLPFSRNDQVLTTTRIEVLSVGNGSYKRKHRSWWSF
jgi:stalled ribosome alternative rescue factor ArfA